MWESLVKLCFKLFFNVYMCFIIIIIKIRWWGCFGLGNLIKSLLFKSKKVNLFLLVLEKFCGEIIID